MEGGIMSTPQILLLIGAFLTLTVGSFIYYVATWDADKEQPVSLLTPGLVPALAKNTATTGNTPFTPGCAQPVYARCTGGAQQGLDAT